MEQLAELMLEAYRGTPDDEGETLEDAQDEIGATLVGQYGPLNLEASAAHYDGEALASALAQGVAYSSWVSTTSVRGHTLSCASLVRKGTNHEIAEPIRGIEHNRY